MGCGCKKKSNQPVNNEPANVTIRLNESNNPVSQPDIQLTPEQQKQVDEIVEKINKINL
jgi:hypothetical protein